MRQFDTSIKILIEEKNKYNLNHNDEVIFLSNWDVSVDVKPYRLIFYNYPINEQFNSYYYWTDEQGYALYFSDFYKNSYNKTLNSESFLIGNNGTSSIMLSLLALTELNIERVLVFTPIYFSTLNLLEMLNMHVFRYDLSITNDFQINMDALETFIKKNKIEVLFITDPIFGTGVEHNLDFYRKLSELTLKYNLWNIVDYVYGGMLWNEDNCIFNSKSDYIINNLRNTIFIESISKRLFINGIKFSLVFSEKTIIKKIKRLSIYTTGSMCLNQLETYRKIYDLNNIDDINNIINNNKEHALKTYNKIVSFLVGEKCITSKCNSSFFIIIGIPKTKYENDINIALNFVKNKGVLTIPHSRYLLESEKYYFFRVNLLQNIELLFEGLSRILS